MIDEERLPPDSGDPADPTIPPEPGPGAPASARGCGLALTSAALMLVLGGYIASWFL
jgi:hypothetical protein